MAVKFTKKQIDSLLNQVEVLGNSTPRDSMIYSGFTFYHHPMSQDNVYLRYREKGYESGGLVNKVTYVCVKKNGDIVDCMSEFENGSQRQQFIFDMEEIVIDNGVVKFKE